MKGTTRNVITAVLVFYFSLHGIARATQPASSYGWQFQNSQPVPVNQITNIVQPPTEVVNPAEEKPQVIGLAIAFGIAICVIGWILYQIIKLLDKVIPPPDKQPDPPPQSPTNSPPVTFNQTGSPGPAPTSMNRMTLNTNTQGSTVNCYNILPFKFVNNMVASKNPPYFDRYFSVTTELSTNLVDWQDSHYRISAYITSGVGVLYMYFHYETNFYNVYFTGDYIATNHTVPAWFDLTDRPYQPKQFFRLISE